MRPRIKLAFCDFWPKFDPRDNYFTRLLGERFEIELSDAPQFVVFSCFGREHRRYDCTRIFYTGENWRPDFRHCDYAFTFDHCDDPRHYRLPIYGLYCDPAALVKPADFDPARQLAEKTRFCSFVYSNPLCRTRNRFFRQLSKYKSVDSGGRLFNNLGGPIADKLALLRQSKFTIAFENESHPGYTTEKLSEAMQAGSLPIYWGNPRVQVDFNPRSFINAHDWPSLEAVIEHVIQVDRDDQRYLAYLREPWYHENRVNPFVDRQNVLGQFERIFGDPRPHAERRRGTGRYFFLDSLREMPQSMLRRVKRTTRKMTCRLDVSRNNKR